MNELTPISLLKKRLDVLIPEGWKDYEVETLLLSLGLMETRLLRDKLNLVKVVILEEKMFYENVMFFLHAVSVMNNHFADFDHIPHVDSLEMAFAIKDMAATVGSKLEESHVFNSGLRKAISYLLTEEGYSEVISPFDTVGITGLSSGQTKEDSSNKEKAIAQYVSSMYN